MRPEVNSDRFEISNRFEMLFRLHDSLHGDFTAVTFQTIARLYCTVKSQNGLSSLQDKISLRCVVTLLSVFTWLRVE